MALSFFFLMPDEGKTPKLFSLLRERNVCMPNTSMELLLSSTQGIMVEKIKFILRYFIKMGMRMLLTGTLDFSKALDEKYKDRETLVSVVKELEKARMYNIEEMSEDEKYQDHVIRVRFNTFDVNKDLAKIEASHIVSPQHDENNNNNNTNKEEEIIPKKTYSVTMMLQNIKWIVPQENIADTTLHTGYLDKYPCYVNFANKILGGGCLSRGAVQEEILFLDSPDLFAARYLVTEMESTDAIVIDGFEVISEHSGYSSSSMSYKGPHIPSEEEKKMFSSGTKRTLVCVDAVCYSYYNYVTQFETKWIDRDIIKFISGLQMLDNDTSNNKTVSTGFWGCGAFNGNKALKFLEQLLSCLLLNKKMIFSTFGDDALCELYTKFIRLLSEAVGKRSLCWGVLYKCLLFLNREIVTKSIDYNDNRAVLNAYLRLVRKGDF